jgi:hypothetical protein
VGKAAPGEAFLLVLRFSPVSTIAPVLYTHFSFIDTLKIFVIIPYEEAG